MVAKRIVMLFVPLLFSGAENVQSDWKKDVHKSYTLYFRGDDESEKKRYAQMIDRGIKSVNAFSKENYKSNFDVYVHPNRAALDNQWQNDWKMPEFKSECWMVASGIAGKLDLLSPLKWSTEACEHVYADKDKTQKVITHELFHIFHAQKNPSPDFAETQGLDWFVEGFATYASGQCDTERMTEVKKAVQDKKAPTVLDNFWKGKTKYGLSGSLVGFLDVKYGRSKLLELLKFKSKDEVLGSLKISESDLLKEWADHIVKTKG